MRITGMKQGVKNPERVNVYVDGVYMFSLFVTQVVELGVKIGKELSLEELERMKQASEFGKLYQRALEWVLVRPRSMREVRDYLMRKLKGVSREECSEFSHEIISRLVCKGYLDDEKFAEWYVENRFVKKGVASRRLKMELMKKGVSGEIIDRVLNNSSRNDEEEILKMIAKKRAKYDDDKLTQYLCRQGFSYELVQNLVQSYGKD